MFGQTCLHHTPEQEQARINPSAQMGKLRHNAGRSVPCHTRSFTHRTNQKPLSWRKELVLSITGSVTARCGGLGETSEKGHSTLDLSLFAPSPGSCHQALAMRAALLGAPAAWPDTAALKCPETPGSHRYSPRNTFMLSQ